MGKTEKRFSEGLAWLRFVLNPESGMPVVSDWRTLYEFADKQKITGVCDPTKYDVKIGIDVLSLWLRDLEQIKASSSLLNKRVEELNCLLDETGFRHCILKGQGNAEMYPEPLMRMPGDIDVWLDADVESIERFVKNKFPEAAKSYKHIKYPIFDDVPVDVHETPLKFCSPKNNKRLQQWIEDNKKEQFEHRIQFTGVGKEINVPTARFNAVYQLGHMLIHLYDEGIGLRHFVDHYYVLKNLNVSDKERTEIVRDLKSLGLLRFAKAVMWIEKEVLGLRTEGCIVESDEKLGTKLLEDVLEGGNFGKYSERYRGWTGFYWMGMIEAMRILKLMNFAPSEAGFCFLRKMKTAILHIR